MGSKTVKTSEKKPSHKIPVARKEEKIRTFSDLPLYEKKCLIRMQKLDGSLQHLGLDHSNDESVKKKIRWLTKAKNKHKQRALARELVKNPINFSLMPDRVSKETKDLFNRMIVRAGENVPETFVELLNGKLLDKFGPSNSSFVGHLQSNIWLKVLSRLLQDFAGFSDERIAEMQPLHQLWLLQCLPAKEDQIKKVLVREFGLDTPSSYPVEHIITELVEKMVKAFAEVAPEEAVALGVEGISLGE